MWGPSRVESSHYLRIYMGQLRHKLEENPANPRFLLTEIGVGYRLMVEQSWLGTSRACVSCRNLLQPSVI